MVNDTVLHFKEIFHSLTADEVVQCVKDIERIAETIGREDRDNPGQKLVWFPAAVQASMAKIADNTEQQARILQSMADSVQLMTERLQYMEMFVKMKGGGG